MQLQLRRSPILRMGLLALLSFGVLGTVWGQEVLVSDANLPPSLPSSQRSVPASNGSLRLTTLTLPFFDDFSSESSSPDTNRWAFSPNDLKRPNITTNKGLNPPSKGVATFDGTNFNGVKYDATFGSGETDTLTSQPIDLSGFSPADSVYLSFFVERGGAGETPETFDSLVVLFHRSGQQGYEQVWGLRGNGAAESNFQWYFVPLDSAAYFHNAFQFKFVAFGSYNGELDQFHLDYVQLDAQRSRLDTQLSDISPTSFSKSVFAPYSAVPRKQLRRGTPMTSTETIVANAADPATTATLTLSIDDPIGANTFVGTTIVSANVAALPGFGHETASGAAFGTQSANMNQYGSIRLTAVKTSPADLHPENDTIRRIFPVDSTLGYDDGVGDFGYGLTTARAFCQQYDIDQPDTLVAVWIHFSPSLHYNQPTNQSTDLVGKGFRLVVWDSLEVDSALLETSGGMNVAYGTGPDQFIRYQMIREVEVPTRFWVGLRQVDGMPIGLGFDRNDTTRRIYFENNISEFQRSNNRGTLMIRPEFKVPSATVGLSEAQPARHLQFLIAPNPILLSEIGVHIADAAVLRSITFEMYDWQGRLMQHWEPSPSAKIALSMTQQVPSGIYWLRASGRDRQGNLQIATQKLRIEQQ